MESAFSTSPVLLYLSTIPYLIVDGARKDCMPLCPSGDVVGIQEDIERTRQEMGCIHEQATATSHHKK